MDELKVNQVGTVTETLEAIQDCRDDGFGQMVSHRSGETTYDFIADLAVGCGQLKAGGPARGCRVTTVFTTSPAPRAVSRPLRIPRRPLGTLTYASNADTIALPTTPRESWT